MTTERAITYSRVSTDEQAETGYGLSYQDTRCSSYCTLRDYSIVGSFTDDYSGRVALRPGMTDLLDAITQLRATVVVVDRTDRLGRHAAVQEVLEAEIEARGARVEFVSAAYDRATPAGRAMRRIAGVFDQLDYEVLVERLKSHKAEAVRRGSIINTRPPYGYGKVTQRGPDSRRVTTLEIDEAEAEIVRLIFTWYTAGDETGQSLSIKGIVIRLNALGVTPRRGRARSSGHWSAATIFDMLHCATYAGRWHYNRTMMLTDPVTQRRRQIDRPPEDWITVAVPAIVTEETYQQAQARGRENLARAARNRKHTYLFTGMLRCTTCGQRMAGRTNSGSGGSKFYRCGDRSHVETMSGRCPPLDYKESDIDAVVWHWITELATYPDRIRATLEQRQAQAVDEQARIVGHIQTIERLIKQKEQEQSTLIRLYAKTPIDALEGEIAQLAREIDAHRAEGSRLQAHALPGVYSPAQLTHITEVCAIIAEALPYFTAEEKRRTYELFQFTGRVAVEDNVQVVYAECALSLDVARLPVVRNRVQRNDVDVRSDIRFGSSPSVARPGR